MAKSGFVLVDPLVGVDDEVRRDFLSDTTGRVRVSLETDLEKWRVTFRGEHAESSGDMRQQEDNRLKLVAEAYLAFDAHILQEISLGGVVHREVERGHNVLGSMISPENTADAIRFRPALSDFVRPLLLPEPRTDELYSFQKAGVDWLESRKVAILGDDMGLGKTAQAISAARRLIQKGEITWCIVVCPTSLLFNWAIEIQRWAPEMTFIRVTPSARHGEGIWRKLFGRVHILLTSYDHLRSVKLSRTPPEVPLVIADEAHRLRNLTSLTSKGVRSLAFERFWALTGTPIEKSARDMATLLSIIDPYRFDPSDGLLPAQTIRVRSREYFLRRRKNEVLTDLPPVTEIRERIELASSQKAAYKAEVKRLKSASWESGEVLAGITRLRQICDFDPATGESSKIARIVSLIEEVAEMGEKAVVFSHLLEPIRLLKTAVANRLGPKVCCSLTGEMDEEKRESVLHHFRESSEVTVLLASSKVAGEGLTLTAANHAFFLNEWWNPTSNSQARDRLVRIGQKRPVVVRTFTCVDTIEERLLDILKCKGATIDEIVERLAEEGPDNCLLHQLL